MNTPTHVLLGMAAFGARGRPRTTAAALGGMLPDIPAIALVTWALRIEDRTPAEVFDGLYFSDAWQALLSPWHAAPPWVAVLAIGLVARAGAATAFGASGLLHVACDFLLHADDPHRHFWPFTDWRFYSPLSYWDPRHYGDVVQPLEVALTVGLAAFLAVRHRSSWMRAALGLLLGAYAAQFGVFFVMFG